MYHQTSSGRCLPRITWPISGLAKTDGTGIVCKFQFYFQHLIQFFFLNQGHNVDGSRAIGWLVCRDSQYAVRLSTVPLSTLTGATVQWSTPRYLQTYCTVALKYTIAPWINTYKLKGAVFQRLILTTIIMKKITTIIIQLNEIPLNWIYNIIPSPLTQLSSLYSNRSPPRNMWNKGVYYAFTHWFTCNPYICAYNSRTDVTLFKMKSPSTFCKENNINYLFNDAKIVFSIYCHA